MNFKLSVSQNSSQVLRKLVLLGNRGIFSIQEVMKILDTIGMKMLEAARKNSPGTKFPKGWELINKTTASKFHLSLINTVISGKSPLFRYLEEGTRPHLIKANRARSLSFTVDSNRVFAKIVRHPGTRPYGMAKAAIASADVEVEKIKSLVAQAIKRNITGH